MFAISPVNHEFDQQIQTNIDSKTKPLGALGELETLALQIAQVLGGSAATNSSPSNAGVRRRSWHSRIRCVDCAE
ncbi:hypothetical protein TUM4644_01270 [Shewanella colwelliana]|nr:hypothetical protein TUM4644_01270 [Shewanella colwelliana]